MRRKIFLAFNLISLFTVVELNAQAGEGLMGALQKGLVGLTFSNEQAAQMAKEAVVRMDAGSQIAGPTDPYFIRLNKIFDKHKQTGGLSINYKVYLIKEINAFATADGSIRIYSGLMDVMDDNELLAVIGHEIGHIANNDSRDAVKAAYQKEALIEGIASQSDAVAKVTDSQLGKIGSAMIDSKHSRKQESEADMFAYDFMKVNGYDVNAVESALSILAKLSEGSQIDILARMMSSHPDPRQRAESAKNRAINEGLYKPYVHQVKVVAPIKKPTVYKKSTSSKKKVVSTKKK